MRTECQRILSREARLALAAAYRADRRGKSIYRDSCLSRTASRLRESGHVVLAGRCERLIGTSISKSLALAG